MLEFLPTTIDGCYKIQPKVLTDYRGTFAKLFHSDTFQLSGLKFSIHEVLLSSSAKNVLRGMHFQISPKSTAKLVACLSGDIFDGIVDLRKQSPTYLKTYTTRLSEHDPTMIFIPEGLAHGFYSFQENSTVLYMTSGVFSAEHDAGISWKSVGIDWPVADPIISERDQMLVPLHEFVNPF